MVFFGCNISLFVFLPFAYFFTESAGLSGSRKVTQLPPSLTPPSHSPSPLLLPSPSSPLLPLPLSISQGVMSRVYETLLVLLLLAVLVCGLSWLLTLLLDHDTSWVGPHN